MKKRTLALVCALTLGALTLTACGGGSGETAQSSAPAQTQAAQEETAYSSDEQTFTETIKKMPHKKIYKDLRKDK